MIFAPGVFFVSIAIWLALGIVVAVDANKYPDTAFLQTGSSKGLWQIVPIVLAIPCGLGTLIMAIVWFASKKPALERAAGGGPYGGGYGYPPPPPTPQQQGWAPPPQQAPPSWGPPQQAPPPPPPPPPEQGQPPNAPPTWGAPPPQQ